MAVVQTAIQKLIQETSLTFSDVGDLISLGFLYLTDEGLCLEGRSFEETKEIFCRGYTVEDLIQLRRAGLRASQAVSEVTQAFNEFAEAAERFGTVAASEFADAIRGLKEIVSDAPSQCQSCSYHSSNAHLPCAVHPQGPEGECQDWEERIE